MSKLTMDKLVALCKNRGFIFSGSEIYGGLANSWDYGPLGIELQNNIKKVWWKSFVQENPYNVGLDSAILMNPKVWEVSGHLGGFSDPLMDCKVCKTRHRADTLIENHLSKKEKNLKIEGLGNLELKKIIEDEKINCPNCGSRDFTDIRSFNLMFKTFMGVTEDSLNTIYLRPETAQGIFVNFKNVLRATRSKMPLGIAQIGKSFRNEITPGNFIFRTREFEQMELEFFCSPQESEKWFNYWREYSYNWLINLGIKPQNLKLRDHSKEELSHYSRATTDIEFNFPFGFGELWGIADRTDFDLKRHGEASGVTMEYTDATTGEKYIPHCIEPSLGVGRMLLAFLTNAYEEEKIKEEDFRVVLKLHPALAPYKVAILPLIKKSHSQKALEIYQKLSKHFMCDYDETASIGKRYRRQDEIGTPFCITIDEDTLNNNTVTIRYRDTMEQEVLDVDTLVNFLQGKLFF